MPAIDISKLPRDQTGQPVYPSDPGYQAALDRQNQALLRMDQSLGKAPAQEVPIQTPATTIQPNPFGGDRPTINEVEQNVGNLLAPKKESSAFDWVNENIFNPAGNLLKAGGEKISDVASGLGKGISKAASDVGDWAYENRVGLGGFGTAIGAGLAGRDASEALSRYNQAIIANKKQRQEELQFDMATNPNNPYNQQFRELFAKMLPDVTAKLGDSFNKMTAQNFRDAGLDKLLDTAQKQIEISKFDPNSSFSKQARAAATSQYGIEIPENVSGIRVPDYIEAEKLKIQNQFKEREVANKENKLQLEVGKGMVDEKYKGQELKLKEAEEKRKAQMFPLQLEEQKVKSEIATKTKDTQIDTIKQKEKELELSNLQNDPNNPQAELARKELIKRFPSFKKLIPPDMTLAGEANVIKGIEDFRLEAKSLTDRKSIADALRKTQLNIASMNDKTRRLGLQQEKQYRDEIIKLKKLDQERKNIEFAYKNPLGRVNEKQLEQAGISKKDISELVSYSGDVQNAKDLVNEFKDILSKKGRFSILSDAEIRGKLQTMRTRFAGIIKRKDVLGALDAGVLTYVDQLLADPTAYTNAFKPNSQIISQANAVLRGFDDEEKNQYLVKKFDPRLARDIGRFQSLVKKAGEGDANSYTKFRDMGYSKEQINQFYENRFDVIGEEGDE